LENDQIVSRNLLDVKGGRFVPQDHQLFSMRNAADYY